MNTTSAASELRLGLDTGGTYTDAVALEEGRGVIASAKALTTPGDLSIGIGNALRALLAQLPPGSDPARIALVSVSTTLATNAVVERRFSPVCTLLIGFDDGMERRSGLADAGGRVVRVAGGHTASGEEAAPLDEAAVEAAVREHGAAVEAFAVAAAFSVRNPAHERRARSLIRALSAQPVTCAHELSSRLDAPRRALTATLNARLTPQIRRLIDALATVLDQQRISAPLMIVKGDGSLMQASVALEYPVETLLSGPAASVVGAGHLTGLANFVVSDIGGTTTDVAIVADGRPSLRAEGALVGDWRTMVEAIDVRTSALGGDSEIALDRHAEIEIGPRKVVPVSLAAQRHPALLDTLRALAAQARLPERATEFAWSLGTRDAPAHLSPLERRVLGALTPEPRPLSTLVQTRSALAALRRLADAGLAAIAGLTPSDAMHVLGRQRDWCAEAAEIAVGLLAIEERNGRAAAAAESPSALAERIVEAVLRESVRRILGAVLGHDPGVEPARAGADTLSGRLIEDVAAGRRFSHWVRATLALEHPLVAIGAPAAAYYPEIARRLGARLHVPEHAAVCNAVGAVAGVVTETVDVVVEQPALNLFRVLDPSGSRDYSEPEAAIEHARRAAHELAFAAAVRAGAPDPHVKTEITRVVAHLSAGSEYLAEARARSTATGRPLAGLKSPARDGA